MSNKERRGCHCRRGFSRNRSQIWLGHIVSVRYLELGILLPFYMADAPTPGGDRGDGENDEEPEENDEEDPYGDINGELAAELDLALCDDEES